MTDDLVPTTPVAAPRILVGARVVTPAGILPDGWVRLRGDRILEVGSGPPPTVATAEAAVETLPGGWLTPGFIDLHMHGGGGHDVTASPADMAAAVRFHRAHGTTRTLVSLVTAPVEALCEQLGWVADLADHDPGVLGSHLEGPFLAASRCGAQNPLHLRTPDRGVLAELIAAGRGTLRCITIAPELPGALDLIDDARTAGVVVAVGHTDATYDQTRAAFERGATLATHLYNGMRPVHHREPGPVLAALDSGAVCEVINDGVHVHPAVLAEVLARGPERLALVTDAIDAAGAAPGRYRLGGLEVAVDGHEARLVPGGALAGSVLTLDAAVRRAVEHGVSMPVAVRAATSNPAAVLGTTGEAGVIAPGGRADLAHLDEQLRCRSTMVAGQWLAASYGHAVRSG